MGKYSSDSDSSDNGRGRYSKRSSRKGRSRSSSSDSGHRRAQPRHKKRCKGRRSRSKDRYSKSRRYDRKSRRSSSSGSSSDSSKRRSRRSPVSSSSATNSSSLPPQVQSTDMLAPIIQSTPEQLRAKVQRAIEAARSADNMLRQRRGEAPVPDIPLVHQASTLDDINSDGFVQRTFSSSASAPRASLPEIPLPVIVDLTEEPKHTAGGDLGVMSPVLLEDQEGRQLRWVKKLYNIRQRALQGEPMVT